MEEKDKSLVVFQDRKVKRIWSIDRWYFSVVDIIAVLSESDNPATYWRVLKHREPQLVTICNGFKMLAEDGKLRYTDCVDTEQAFRLIQSIPSKRAEPFKQWLAKVGYERIQEIENPELAQSRMKKLYEEKGYSKEWIEKRLRGQAVRIELTDEWKNRGIEQEVEFAILTNEISKATFGKTVEEYKKYKGLQKENLRDHMNDFELIFTMLGEKMTTEITRDEDSKGLSECKTAAVRGGKYAGKAKNDAEKELGRPITSSENYLDLPEKVKRKRLKSR